jgi:hypothetical protein
VHIETGADVAHLPFVKDVHGLAVHAYHQEVSVGLVDFDHPGGEDFTIGPTDYTDRVLRPSPSGSAALVNSETDGSTRRCSSRA